MIRKIDIAVFTILLIFVSDVLASGDTAKVLTAYFFGSATCGECKEIKEVVLTPLLEKHPEKLRIEFHEVEDENSFQFMIKLEEFFKIADPSPQELFLPDTFLNGYESIMTSAETLILSVMDSPQRWKPRWNFDTTSARVDDSLSREEQEARLRGEKTGPIDYLRDIGMLIIGILCITFRKKRFAAIAGQLVLGAVFMIAGRKVGATKEIADVIAAYGVLSESLVSPASVILPWTELVTGLMLIIGLYPKAGAAVISAMNLAFIPALFYRAVSIAISEGTNFFTVSFNCGCGLGENLAWVLILRDIGYLLMGVSILLFSTTNWNITSQLSKKLKNG